jgi:hypothetical protein
MKIFISLIAIIILVGGAFYFLSKSTKTANTTNPTPSPSAMASTSTPEPISDTPSITFCLPKDLEGTVNLEGAAGNIYGTVAIVNISQKKCEIMGNNFLTADYTAQNITVKNNGEVGPSTMTLLPGKTVYSQIHYPNGPQCSGMANQTKITLKYQINSNEFITFKTQTGDGLSIPTCSSSSEITQLDLWSLSTKPING